MEFTKKKKGRCKRGCAAKESRNLYTTIDKELLWNICKCRRLGLKVFYTKLKKKTCLLYFSDQICDCQCKRKFPCFALRTFYCA